MIQSKSDYKLYVKSDEIALGGVTLKTKIKSIFIPSIWKFERKLRRLEYYLNCKSMFSFRNLIYWWLYFDFWRYSTKLGYTIPPNVFGPGLCICHIGTIVINGDVRFGANARIHAGINIGKYGREENKSGVPKFGNNIYIGPGAKIFGDVIIGDNVAIGANAVVTKNVPNHVTVAGVPAVVINERGSDGLVIYGYLKE